jgi:dTDP-4-dehydrorhamnose reductase
MSLPQPVLIVGARGMLGRAWRQMLEMHGIPCTAIDRDGVDITDPHAVNKAIDGSHAVVVNCAAYTNVDAAETDEATATKINGEAPGLLAQACARRDVLLVHYSTDYVFNGQSTTPYRTDQAREPLGAYGRSKAVGEQRVLDAGGRALILRTSWLYAPWANNFVRTIARHSLQKPSLRVVNDQRGRPTSAEHLADASWRLIRADATGIHHVTDGGECTWFDFAAAIAHAVAPACRVEPCTTAEFPRPAKRPAYSVLDLSRTEALIGPMPDWRTNLASVLDRLERPL